MSTLAIIAIVIGCVIASPLIIGAILAIIAMVIAVIAEQDLERARRQLEEVRKRVEDARIEASENKKVWKELRKKL